MIPVRGKVNLEDENLTVVLIQLTSIQSCLAKTYTHK